MLPVDHLVYATPTLEETVGEVAEMCGVTPGPGGRHPAWGTRNHLLSLGGRTYLEIIGPDPSQPPPPEPRIFGLDSLERPRLVRWAARASSLGPIVREARRAGVELGELLPGKRLRTDGVLLSWELTDPRIAPADGLVPFLIDWLDSPHPARNAPGNSPSDACRLLYLTATHPDPDSVRSALRAIPVPGIAALPVQPSEAPELTAVLSTPRGEVQLT